MSETLSIRTKNEPELIITESALKKAIELKKQMTPEPEFLRIRVSPGGCAGFSYDLSFDSNKDQDDIVIEKDSLKIVLDDISLELLNGSTLDFIDALTGAGFKISNPNAHSCSCGKSFG